MQGTTEGIEKLGSGETVKGIEFLGVRWIGLNPTNGQKLLATIALIVIMLLLAALLRWVIHRFSRGRTNIGWITASKQVVNLLSTFVITLGVLSIWFDDPSSLATAFGLVTAGVAFALQKVITSFAGYFVILRGKIFKVGDRIAMGGVRGDVIQLDLTQTTVMEMGQPPSVQNATPEIWVRSRQYTGRVVSIPNAKVFEEPVYNYSRELPFLWEELSVPVSYSDDRHKAEEILLDVASRHSVKAADLDKDAMQELSRLYPVEKPSLKPTVFWRLTDNWLELTVRFLTRQYGVRTVKDRMSRDLIASFDEAGIGIASATFEVVGLPKLQIEDKSS